MGDAADDVLHFMTCPENGFYPTRERRAPTIVTCRYCGKEDLRWGNVKGGGWRVKNKDGSLHHCKPHIERLYAP